MILKIVFLLFFLKKLDKPLFNMVKRSKYGKRVDFKLEIIEYKGNNCYIPMKGYCFIKCINYLTGLDYLESFLEFIRNEKRKLNVSTLARIQPFLKELNVQLGYYNGREIWPRDIREQNTALYLHKNHFCLNWKS